MTRDTRGSPLPHTLSQNAKKQEKLLHCLARLLSKQLHDMEQTFHQFSVPAGHHPLLVLLWIVCFCKSKEQDTEDVWLWEGESPLSPLLSLEFAVYEKLKMQQNQWSELFNIHCYGQNCSHISDICTQAFSYICRLLFMTRQKHNGVGEFRSVLSVRSICSVASFSPVLWTLDTMERGRDGSREPTASSRWCMESEKTDMKRWCKIYLILSLSLLPSQNCFPHPVFRPLPSQWDRFLEVQSNLFLAWSHTLDNCPAQNNPFISISTHASYILLHHLSPSKSATLHMLILPRRGPCYPRKQFLFLFSEFPVMADIQAGPMGRQS